MQTPRQRDNLRPPWPKGISGNPTGQRLEPAPPEFVEAVWMRDVDRAWRIARRPKRRVLFCAGCRAELRTREMERQAMQKEQDRALLRLLREFGRVPRAAGKPKKRSRRDQAAGNGGFEARPSAAWQRLQQYIASLGPQ